MSQFIKKIFFVSAIILIAMSACNTPDPVYVLDKTPLIPLPLSVVASDEVMPLDAIGSLRTIGADERLKVITENFINFWEKHTQQKLIHVADLTHGGGAITIEIDKSFSEEQEAYKLKKKKKKNKNSFG